MKMPKTTLILVLALATVPAVGQKCPLTESQSQKSIAAWAKIANFLTTEPRCVNCHGRVNPYLDDIGLDPDDPEAPASQVEHGGDKQNREHNKGSDGSGEMDRGCTTCHDNMAPGNGSNWTLAPNFDSFVYKDATTLCRQIKRGTRTAEHFLGHLQNDNNGINFAGTAFVGNRGLGADSLKAYKVKIQTPSISHDALMQLGHDWVSAMGGEFKGDESCGCELTHDKWSGMIRYALDYKGDEGHEKGPGWTHDWSGSSTTTINISLTNGVGTSQYSVQGSQQVVNWRAGKPEWRISEARSSSKTETSGQGKFPAMADVVISQGKYQVFEQLQLQLAGQSVRSNGGNPVIGKQHIENCDSQHGCTGSDSDLYAPVLPPLSALNGTAQDPNHVTGSVTLKKGGLGMSHRAVSIETMTVDLWRSGSH